MLIMQSSLLYNMNQNLSIYNQYPELYDQIFGSKNEDDLDFLKWIFTFLNLDKFSPILDIGSGTGRLLLPLVKEGYNVQGMEPYQGMNDITRNKAKSQEIEVKLELGSFQSLNYEDKYSLIYSINGTMAYLKDIDEYKQSFSNIARALHPEGYFVVDLMNFYSLIKNYEYPEIQNIVFDEKEILVLTNHEVDYENELWIHKSSIFIQQKEGWKKIDDVHRINMVNRKELILYGQGTGLKVINIFNSVIDRPDNRKGGMKNIILFQKKKV